MTVPHSTTDMKILGVNDIDFFSPHIAFFSWIFQFGLELVEEYSLLLWEELTKYSGKKTS